MIAWETHEERTQVSAAEREGSFNAWGKVALIVWALILAAKGGLQ
jgi:hypothetical protein